MAITAEQATAIATAIENLNKSVQVNEEVLQIIKSMQTTGAAADVAEHNKDLNAHPEFYDIVANHNVLSKGALYAHDTGFSPNVTKKALRLGNKNTEDANETIGFYGSFDNSEKENYPHALDFINSFTSKDKAERNGTVRCRTFLDGRQVTTHAIACRRNVSGAYEMLFGVRTDAGDAQLTLAPTAMSSNKAQDLGSSSFQWKDLYIQNSPIVSSDRRLKQDFAEVPEAVFKAWGSVKFCQYRFKEAVSKKGAEARLHVGLIAQEIVEAFTEQGLDATAYGVVCHDSWDDQYEDVEVSCIPAVLNEKGEVVKPEEPIMEHRLIKPAGDLWTVRYEEALALEAAYQRWRLGKIEAALAAKGIIL